MKFEDERIIHKHLLLSSTLRFTKGMFAYMNNAPYHVGKHHKLICEYLDKVIKGDIRKLMINVPPRYGKCLSPESQVLTSNGLVKARKIKENDTVFSFDNGKLVTARCVAVGKARKESVKIKMRSGREFVCSFDHPMLTPFGYVEASKLNPGDRIQALCTTYEGYHEIDDAELDFVTLMIFDGYCRKHLGFSKTAQEVIDLMSRTCKLLGAEFVHMKSSRDSDYNFSNVGLLRSILQKYGIYDHLAYDKRIPRDWFTLSVRQRLRFLDLMFATDGYAQANGQCGIALANKGLIEDIQHMLSSVGIISSFYYKPNNKAGAWVLCIPRRETVKLLGMITFFQKRKMAERALEKEPVCISDTFPYEIIKREKLTGQTRKHGLRCENTKDISREKFLRLAEEFPCLNKYICDDFYLDKVVDVEPMGVMDLIDIEVEGTHNFIANGLVSHNTVLCSQMFIAYGLALNPKSKFLHLSYSGNLTKENSMSVKDIIESEYYQNVFPEVRFEFGNNTRMKWSTTAGGGEYATSTLGQITGFGAGRVELDYKDEDIDEFMSLYNPDGFSGAIVIDDPLKPDDAISDTVRENVNRRFETTIRNRVNSRKTPIIIIMQRLHEHDLCGYLQEAEPGEWTVLSLPAISTNERGEEVALWPFKHTLEELHKLKNTSEYVFETQYMQNPTPMVGLLYRPFRTYEYLPDRKKAIKRCNCTDSADVGSDFLCSIDFDIHKDGYYVTDVLYTKKPMEYTEQAMAQMVSKDNTDVAFVESNNGGRIFMRNVEKIAREYENRTTRFIGFTQTKNKQVRIFTRSNEVNNMLVFPANWQLRWPEFYHDLVYYRREGINLHDDAPDCCTMIIEKAEEWCNAASDDQILRDFL